MRRGFTLIEVVFAVGILAGSMAVVLSLLPSLVRQSSDSADRLVAQRMGDAVRIELELEAAAIGFDALATAVPIMSSPLSNGLDLVATSQGLQLERVAGGGGTIAADDQRFLVEIWRFSRSPLRYDANAATLPLYVRVSWPYRLPGTVAPTEVGDRDEFTFAMALDR